MYPSTQPVESYPCSENACPSLFAPTAENITPQPYSEAVEADISSSNFALDWTPGPKEGDLSSIDITLVQGNIFAARLCGFSRSLGSSTPLQTSSTDGATDTSDLLRETGLNHLAQARQILEKYPSTALLKDEIDAVESMLNGYVYRQVTAEEHKAMTEEFRGTGHWYVCQNGHPFTIGECGMPMEQARCPGCNAPIGGQNHEPVEGVRHAAEIEEIAGGVDRLRL